MQSYSRAVKPMYFALCDKSMKFYTQVIQTIPFWFRYRTALDLTFGDLCMLFLSEKGGHFVLIRKLLIGIKLKVSFLKYGEF